MIQFNFETSSEIEELSLIARLYTDKAALGRREGSLTLRLISVFVEAKTRKK